MARVGCRGPRGCLSPAGLLVYSHRHNGMVPAAAAGAGLPPLRSRRWLLLPPRVGGAIPVPAAQEDGVAGAVIRCGEAGAVCWAMAAVSSHCSTSACAALLCDTRQRASLAYAARSRPSSSASGDGAIQRRAVPSDHSTLSRPVADPGQLPGRARIRPGARAGRQSLDARAVRGAGGRPAAMPLRSSTPACGIDYRELGLAGAGHRARTDSRSR